MRIAPSALTRPPPGDAAARSPRGDADRARSEASRVLREKEALRERVAGLQSAADRAAEATEAAVRERDEARLEAAAASRRAQQEREGLAEIEGENEGLRARLQMAEEDVSLLASEADQVGRRPRVVWSRPVTTGSLALRRRCRCPPRPLGSLRMPVIACLLGRNLSGEWAVRTRATRQREFC